MSEHRRHKYEVIGPIPDVTAYGPEAVHAAEELGKARVGYEEASEALQALTAGEAGPSSFVTDPAFNKGKPSHAEAAAIEADRALMRAALEAGQDIETVGTPNVDQYRRDRLKAELHVDIAHEKLLAADHALWVALKDGASTARPTLAANTHKALDDYRQAANVLRQAHGAAWAAWSAVGYCDRVDETDSVTRGSALGFNASGTHNIKHPGRLMTLAFDDLLAFATADANDLTAKVGTIEVPEPDIDGIDDPASARHRAGTADDSQSHDAQAQALPNRDNRFSSDVPTRRRQRVRSI